MEVPKPAGIPDGVDKGIQPLPRPDQGFVAGRSAVDAAVTSPTKLEYVNPDGTRTTEMSGTPVRFKGTEGAWRDYDLKLRAASEVPESAAARDKLVTAPDDLVMLQTDSALVLPADPARGLVRLTTPAGEFALSLVGKAGAPVIDEKDPYTVRYPTGVDGVVATVSMRSLGFEQSLVVDKASGPSSYRLTVTLPDGVTARESKTGVEFTDATGASVGGFGRGVATDSSGSLGASAPVTTELVTQTGATAVLQVSVAEKWFGDDKRLFPVTIDPVWITSSTYGFADTQVNTNCWDLPCPNWSGDAFIHVGDFGTELADGLFWFQGGMPTDVTGSKAGIKQAELCVYTGTGNNSAASYPGTVYGANQFNTAGLSWNNHWDVINGGVVPTTFTMPTPTTSGSATTSGWVSSCSSPGWASADAGPATAMRKSNGDNYVAVMLHSDANGSGKVFNSSENPIVSSHPVLRLTWRREPYAATLTTLANNTTVASTTPTLGATLPNPLEPSADGQTIPTPVNISAWYEVHSGPSLSANTLVSSSLLSGMSPGGVVPAWTVPDGVLKDGGSYYWTVRVLDGALWNSQNVFRKFTVDRQLGANVVSPTDALGPATVNLATGNLNVSAASQSMPTVGGKLGMNYAYKSLAPNDQGLSIDYYSTPDLTGAITGHQEMSTLWAAWGVNPPEPGVGGFGGAWSARLSGYFVTTAPSSSYKFWVSSGQDVTIKSGSTYEFIGGFLNPLQKIFGHFEAGAIMSNLPAGRHPISIEYRAGGASAFDIRLTTSGAPSPPDYFSAPPGSAPMTGSALSLTDNPMPAGWVASPDADGSLPYVSLRTEPNAVRLYAADGSSDTFSFDAQGIRPLSGAAGTLKVNCGQLAGMTVPECWWDYDDGHLIEHFDFAGNLKWSFNTTDRAHPAVAKYTWGVVDGAESPRLTRITDPVSTRYVSLTYQNAAKTNCPTDVDPAPPEDTTDGYVQPLPGTLCQVDFTQWGGFGGYNQLLYKYSGADYLYEIVGLGQDSTGFDREQFVYASGQMTQIRDAAAMDVLSTVPAAAQTTNQTKTVIAYDTAGRVVSLTGPEPNPTATANANSRAKNTYNYASTSQTIVSQKYPNGTSVATRVARTVSYDPTTTRLLTDTDAAGHASSQTWDNAANAVKSKTDPAGVKTTTIFEPFTHRATDSYGPAPANQFNSQGTPATDPGTGNPYPIAHSSIQYDTTTGGTVWTGLTARYFNTAYLAPDPYAQQAPVATDIYNGSGGIFNSNWPVAGAPAGLTDLPFSASFTGLINLDQVPQSGLQWQFAFTADDGISLTIDDQNVTSGWSPGNALTGVRGELPFALTSAGWHKIRIDYQDTGGNSSFSMSYRLGTLGQAQETVHPWYPTTVDHLRPNLELATRATDPDGKLTTTSYTDSTNNPSLNETDGLATKTTVDPAGLNLVTKSFYETANSTSKYLRQIGAELPKGTDTHTDDFYYDNTTPTAGQIPTPVASGCSTAVSINQGGLVRLHFDADPDDTGPLSRNSTRTYYNRQGLPAYTQQRGDSTWGCIEYDARLRTTQTVTGSSTLNTNYATPGQVTASYANPEPGATPATLTTVTRFDVLGRITSYQDEHGTLTEPIYDVTGRVIERWQTMLPSGTRTKMSTVAYDDDDRVLNTVEYVSTPTGRITAFGYDAAGRPSSTSELTPSWAVVMQVVSGYSPEGRQNTRWDTGQSGAWNWIDQYLGFTPSGKVTIEAETGVQSSLLVYGYDCEDRRAVVRPLLAGSPSSLSRVA